MADAPVLAAIAPGRGVIERALDRSPFVVGRDPGCDLALDYPWLSRRQLVIEAGEDGWRVRAEGKSQVTLDGHALDGEQPLAAGAVLTVGTLTIIFDPHGPRDLALDEAPAEATLEVPVARALAGQSSARILTLLADAGARLAAADDERAAAAIVADAALSALSARTAAVLSASPLSPRSPGGASSQAPSPREAGGGSGWGAAGLLAVAGVPLVEPSRRLIARALGARAAVAVDQGGAQTLTSSSIPRGPALAAPLGDAVLWVERDAGGAPFTDEHAAVTTVLGQLAASALVAARRHADQRRDRDRLADEVQLLQRDAERRFGSLIGGGAAMGRVVEAITRVAPSAATVLIHGETGTGKELVAREIHRHSPRAGRPFLAVNCAALPDTLIESELFGHRRGAFTGADRDRRGVFELADTGTVLLDEIGELSAAAQAKLLRVLEGGEILPVGAGRPVQVDVRVLAATHRDLAAEADAGRFRRDLYFRLKVFPIALPPLRDRLDDIPDLVGHFLASHAEARRKRIAGVTPAALAALAAGGWPGNVRELMHVLERAAILADPGEPIDILHLPDELAGRPAAGTTAAPGADVDGDVDAPLRDRLAAFERAAIIAALEANGWNRTRTARKLGISLRAFMDKLRRYDVRGPEGD